MRRNLHLLRLLCVAPHHRKQALRAKPPTARRIKHTFIHRHHEPIFGPIRPIWTRKRINRAVQRRNGYQPIVTVVWRRTDESPILVEREWKAHPQNALPIKHIFIATHRQHIRARTRCGKRRRKPVAVSISRKSLQQGRALPCVHIFRPHPHHAPVERHRNRRDEARRVAPLRVVQLAQIFELARAPVHHPQTRIELNPRNDPLVERHLFWRLWQPLHPQRHLGLVVARGHLKPDRLANQHVTRLVWNHPHQIIRLLEMLTLGQHRTLRPKVEERPLTHIPKVAKRHHPVTIRRNPNRVT